MAANFASAAEAELACGVCFQFFVKPHEPKNLPKCLHILCNKCLQSLTKGGKKTVKCPHCNQISPLPKEGIDGLKTSLALRNLAERHPKGIEQYKEHMQSQLKCGQEKTANNVEKLNELIKQTQHAIQVEEQEIEKSVEAVMEKAQELIKQLRNTSGLDQLKEQLSKLETEMKHIETSQSNLETMSDEEFLAQTDAITNQVEKLKIDEVTENTPAPCVGKFIPNIQLGRIVKPRQLEMVQQIGEFKWACDIASNSNGVLAVCDWQSKPQQVSVFQKDRTEYKLHSQFPVHLCEEGKGLDIAISEEGQYLVTKCTAGFDVYSSDGRFQKIESVIDQQSGQGKMDVESGSINCTKDGRILVGSRVRRAGEESWHGIVTVHAKGLSSSNFFGFGTSQSLMKTMPIGIRVSQLIDIHGTHVAICSDTYDKVCIIDMHTGNETLSIDAQTINSACYDEQSDCLLIARMTKKDEHGQLVFGSGVIDQYCRITGKLIACVAQGLHWPLGMTISVDNMLAVTDVGSVKLYKME